MDSSASDIWSGRPRVLVPLLADTTDDVVRAAACYARGLHARLEIVAYLELPMAVPASVDAIARETALRERLEQCVAVAAQLRVRAASRLARTRAIAQQLHRDASSPLVATVVLGIGRERGFRHPRAAMRRARLMRSVPVPVLVVRKGEPGTDVVLGA